MDPKRNWPLIAACAAVTMAFTVVIVEVMALRGDDNQAVSLLEFERYQNRCFDIVEGNDLRGYISARLASASDLIGRWGDYAADIAHESRFWGDKLPDRIYDAAAAAEDYLEAQDDLGDGYTDTKMMALHTAAISNYWAASDVLWAVRGVLADTGDAVPPEVEEWLSETDPPEISAAFQACRSMTIPLALWLDILE